MEIKARERALNTAAPGTSGGRPPRALDRGIPTSAGLLSSDSLVAKCLYCRHQHPSVLCKTVTDTAEQKQILRKPGRCFVCLRKHHTSRDCHSPSNCTNCGGRHHTSICKGGVVQDGAITPVSRQETSGTTATNPPQ